MTDNGLTTLHQQTIVAILKANEHVQSAWLFGSRALGTFKANSDIDIVVVGEELNLDDLANILTQIELTSIPFKVDVLIKHKIENDALINHIKEHGVRWL